MTNAHVTSEQEEIDAIHRLSRSSDGPLVRRYFRRQLESCRATDDDGALQRHEGARILARDFLIHMDQGLEPTDAGRTDDTILRAEHAAITSGLRGIKRRVVPDPNVYAYLNSHDGPDAA
jgi:hypothetical protein